MLRTILLTMVTLVAFASNSLLCRLTLADGAIDPVSFTVIRLVSGALALLPLLLRADATARAAAPWSPLAALALIVYASAFSLAYVTLDAGIGALLLFGLVQVTMVGAGLLCGERPTPLQVLGMLAAVGGLAVLLLPGSRAPALPGALLMCAAGVAWGVYSLLGRGTSAPAVATARNFLLAAPLSLLALPMAWAHLTHDARGAWLAIASGALTSGFGYVLWYAALRGHTRTSASIVQLAVPVLAAIGGVLWLGEAFTLRLGVASILTLGGVAIANVARRDAES